MTPAEKAAGGRMQEESDEKDETDPEQSPFPLPPSAFTLHPWPLTPWRLEHCRRVEPEERR